MKSQDYEAAIEVLVRLQAQFPDVIARPEQRERRPLKVGIHDDVVVLFPELDRKTIGRALMLYTRHIAYLRGLVEGAARVDLNGVESGTVTAADAEHARGRAAQHKERATARKSATQEERTEQPPKPEQATKADRLAVGIASLRAAAKARQAKQ
jgi:ProP effector